MTNFNVPGVFVQEGTVGATPAILNSFEAVYVFGTSDNEDAPKDTPVFVDSLDSFTNVFGSSGSASAIKLFFDQRSGYPLRFINVSGRFERTLEVAPTLPVGTVYTINIDGYAISHTKVEGETDAQILAAIGVKINTQIPLIASYYPGIVRYNPGLTVTVNSNLTLGAEDEPELLKPEDVIDSAKRAIEPRSPQGYLCAPEFYNEFDSAEHSQLFNAFEALASDPEFLMVHVGDCSGAVSTLTSGGGAINAAIAERANLFSTRGHSWYYFPHVINLQGVSVPPSLAVIGVALRRTRAEGVGQPSAGKSYPIYGVSGTTFKVDAIIQGQLNPLGINAIRKLPRSNEIVVYGARTLATDLFYRFGSHRVVLNILATSLRDAYDEFIFNLVDGQGALFSRIKQTAANLCEILRLNGLLFGATGADAYKVIADLTNNNLDALDAGEVNVDVIVKLSPVLEVLVVKLSRSSLGAVLAEVQASGNIQPIATNSPSPVT